MVDLINTKSLREHISFLFFYFIIVCNSQTVYLTGILFVSQKKCQVEVVITSALYIELGRPHGNSILISIYRHHNYVSDNSTNKIKSVNSSSFSFGDYLNQKRNKHFLFIYL